MSAPASSVCLVVLDGWGLAPTGEGNAVARARTPVFDGIWERFPHTELIACGRAVGLPAGQMGNSEVGHLNLGAGAAVEQDLTRIDEAVRQGRLDDNEALRDAFDARRVHLIGLVSDGGVHSGWTHLRGLLGLGRGDVFVHAFTDGRDASPTGGREFLRTVEEDWGARVGTVIGRYFAMDRDERFKRTQRAYDLLVHGRGEHQADSAVAAIEAAYARDETDEFVTPTVIDHDAVIRPGDSVVSFNFRPDRVRQLVRALADPDATDVQRGGAQAVKRLTCLTEYDQSWPYVVAFPPQRPRVTLPRVIAAAGGRQLHVAETEKYPHVTYFFGGGKEYPEAGEDRRVVPSPRDVPTYDRKPQMSAREAAAAFVEAWGQDHYRFGIINFANADMVGHTGNIDAAVLACETVDACLAEVLATVRAGGGVCIVTADHGNADEMLEPDGSPDTTHSLNPVPLVVTAADRRLDPEGGVLADVAPTILELLGLEQPAEMTGRSLLR
ncbi:MAG: 2,3-bisphosphoglycerate-independent phosphoglycerate mutase [Solirubrobacterales bacterium]|nr:2,3-bisphosphoglycerate-independent phosphoglycerate mutase [Solirubrobacterales bacterium]